MARLFVCAMLLMLAAPLCAGGLIETVFQQKVADDWYAHFQAWVAETCEGDGCIDTYFVQDEKAVAHRVTGVVNGRLQAVKRDPVKRDVDAKGDAVTFTWEQWLPRYMAVVYPARTNEDDRDVIAFAVWLYLNADDAMLGNRLLTVVYERNGDLKSDIADYVVARHEWGGRERLQIAEAWDAEFRRWRNVLVPRSQAAQMAKDRKTAEKDGLEKLLSEYANPEQRTMTLDQLEHAIREWLAMFEAGDVHRKQGSRITGVLEAIDKDRETISVLFDLAAAREGEDWEQTARDFEKALALDPCRILLLSKTANAWQKHANPEIVGGRFKCTQEHSARRAIEYYDRWLKRDPDNMKVLLNKGVCHHVIGERDAAGKYYKRVIKECDDEQIVKRAREYDRLP